MPKKLKVFRTHIGFYDMIVAAPSMKAAAKTWGAKSNVFAQGFAKQTTDADAVEAALQYPGRVLKRPFGTGGAFQIEPAAIPAPRITKAQKNKAADTKKEQKREEARQAREHAARKARQKADAKAELAAIESEEAQLRQRRQSLRKKFHLHGVN